MAHPGGRPTKYCEEMVEKVCDAIATNAKGMRTLCAENPQLPGRATIIRWLGKHPEFRVRYLQAKSLQTHLLADETIDISNGNDEDTLIKINRDKLKIDTYKFNIVKLNPQDYGDKKDENASPQELLQQLLKLAKGEENVRD